MLLVNIGPGGISVDEKKKVSIIGIVASGRGTNGIRCTDPFSTCLWDWATRARTEDAERGSADRLRKEDGVLWMEGDAGGETLALCIHLLKPPGASSSAVPPSASFEVMMKRRREATLAWCNRRAVRSSFYLVPTSSQLSTFTRYAGTKPL